MALFTLLIMVDALRYDAIDEQVSPFLHNFKKKSLSGRIVPNVSYWILPSIFAGLYPEDSGLGYLLWLDPERSPYRFTRFLPFRNGVRRNDFLGRVFRKSVREAASLVERCRGHTCSRESAKYLNTDGIPTDLLDHFSFADNDLIWGENRFPGTKTLFDLLRDRGDDFIYAGFPGLRDFRTKSIVDYFKEKVSMKTAFYYLYLGDLDGVSHAYGPDSPESRRTLKEIDQGLKMIVETAQRMFGETGVIIFGDHGMVKVLRHVDIESALRRSSLVPGKDYLYFLDSTHARFWFLHPKAKEEITSVLSQISGGHILSEEDLRGLHISYRDRKNFELLYVVEGGNLIYPNFFQRREPVAGMHGYLPDVLENQSSFLLHGLGSTGKLDNPIEMVDIFLATTRMLGLSPSPGSRGHHFWLR